MERETKATRFNYNEIPIGYYDEIANKPRGIRSFWHKQKFLRVAACIPDSSDSLLDIGCFAGTFLGMVSQKKAKHQVGIDILENQINYANNKYGNDFREFHWIKNIQTIEEYLPNQRFQNISIIEVIEHLSKDEIGNILSQAAKLMTKGGRLIITTPNYTSLWPLLELTVNALSKVKYEEQHITKFNYFNFNKTLQDCWPLFNTTFQPEFTTTIHFITPFLAAISQRFATKTSDLIQPSSWKFPFGNLIIASFIKK